MAGGYAWWGEACMAGGYAWWREACMAGGVNGRRDSHCSGRYTSYWNAFLSELFFQKIEVS